MSNINSKIIYFQVICVLLFSSCIESNKDKIPDGIPISVHYATGFSIRQYENCKQISVRNPWDTTRLLQQYVLIDRNEPTPQKLPAGIIIPIPIQNIACLYSIDAAMFQLIGHSDNIKAIAETRYVKLPFLVEGLKNGSISDIGESTALNIEALINISPEVIIVSPFQHTGYGKLETTGIAIVENAGYMEHSPLGRAEWIRFLAAFVDKDKEAQVLMDSIASRYLRLTKVANQLPHRPTVFSETKYGPAWHVAGGNSYMAQIYKDAGSDYLWKDDTSTGSLSLDFESVYNLAENADFWIIKSDHEKTYTDLQKEYEGYTWFRAWKEKKIILCNSGENYYYEEGTMNPDLILADLINCFHPGILPDYTNRYFKPMK